MALAWELNDATRAAATRVRVVKVNDKKSQQFVDLKGRKDEEPAEVLNMQPHGFGSNPPKDTEGVLIPMGGRSDRSLLMLGSHQKYRPKEAPEGASYLYNSSGDIIRVFDKTLDIVHSKQINIQIGKGQDVSGKESKPGENSGPVKSLVFTADSCIITFGNTKITMTNDKILHEAPTVTIKSPNVNLGDEGGTLIGLCGGGCSTRVKAI